MCPGTYEASYYQLRLLVTPPTSLRKAMSAENTFAAKYNFRATARCVFCRIQRWGDSVIGDGILIKIRHLPGEVGAKPAEAGRIKQYHMSSEV